MKRIKTIKTKNLCKGLQRLSSGVLVGFGLLQQIWTTDAAAGPGRGAASRAEAAAGALGRRDARFALEGAVPTVILECEMHLSRAECTSRRRGGRSRSLRTAAAAPPAPPRVRPPAPS